MNYQLTNANIIQISDSIIKSSNINENDGVIRLTMTVEFNKNMIINTDLAIYDLIKYSNTDYQLFEHNEKIKTGEKIGCIYNAIEANPLIFTSKFKDMITNDFKTKINNIKNSKLRNKNEEKTKVKNSIKFKFNNKKIVLLNASEDDLFDSLREYNLVLTNNEEKMNIIKEDTNTTLEDEEDDEEDKFEDTNTILDEEEDKEDKEDDEEDLTNYILIKTSLTEYKIAKEGDKYKSGEKEIIIKNVKYSTTDDFMMNFKVLLENEANQMVTDLVANKIVKNKTLAKKQVLEELKFKVSNKSIKILNGSEEELIEKINNFK